VVMKYLYVTSVLFFLSEILFLSFTNDTTFLESQKRNERVKTAFDAKEKIISSKLKQAGLTTSDFELLLVAYKSDDLLELYVKHKSTGVYKLLTSYSICSRSGQPGPKRRAGDGQVPEGFYYIDRFNPYSSYYLSLGISYPNKSDQLKSASKELGGDIFIHGHCVTIGCMPMTDDKIKEIYLFAVHAKNNGQMKIPVYIFPFRMNDANMNTYGKKYEKNILFWKNLKMGYDKFNQRHEELGIRVSKTGDYIVE
jgi:murein L,D-transpeptidase YafK